MDNWYAVYLVRKNITPDLVLFCVITVMIVGAIFLINERRKK